MSERVAVTNYFVQFANAEPFESPEGFVEILGTECWVQEDGES